MNITFSQNGASLVKVEENRSTGLALKMPPASISIIFRSAKYWVWLLLWRQWVVLPVQTQGGQRQTTQQGSRFVHFGYRSSERPIGNMNLMRAHWHQRSHAPGWRLVLNRAFASLQLYQKPQIKIAAMKGWIRPFHIDISEVTPRVKLAPGQLFTIALLGVLALFCAFPPCSFLSDCLLNPLLQHGNGGRCPQPLYVRGSRVKKQCNSADKQIMLWRSSLSVTLCFSSLIGSHTWDCLNFPPAQHSSFPFILGVELIVSSKKQHFHTLGEEHIYQSRARKVANIFQRSFTCIWNVGEQLSPVGLFKDPLVCAVIWSQRKCP